MWTMTNNKAKMRMVTFLGFQALLVWGNEVLAKA
jgi:hypothetical protein